MIDVERLALETIKDYDLFSKDDKVAVAVSGGKDSMSLLNILKGRFNITALFIDVGIPKFSEDSFRTVSSFCEENNIPIKRVSLKEVVGFTTPEAVKVIGGKACTTCSVLKRYALNKSARGFDKLATGHNLDDEAESVMMNLFKVNISSLLSLGPKTGLFEDEKFVQRVKPFYFVPEKDILEYAVKKKIPFVNYPCPMRGDSPFRYFIKQELDGLENTFPNVKQNIVKSFLNNIKNKAGLRENHKLYYCKYCGEPSSSPVCNACKIRLEVSKKLKTVNNINPLIKD